MATQIDAWMTKYGEVFQTEEQARLSELEKEWEGWMMRFSNPSGYANSFEVVTHYRGQIASFLRRLDDAKSGKTYAQIAAEEEKQRPQANTVYTQAS